MNALLDYGTSSSGSSDEDNEETPDEKPTEDASKPKLPKPALGESSLQTSVFSNPFVEAELAKAAILEKHVKMVPGKDNTQMINGKKICWNYRKGRCRFGHNCKYAHDSDIQKSAEELQAEKQKLKTVVCEGSGTMSSVPPPQMVLDNEEDTWEGEADRRKMKRPGLSQGLVPGKKVIKMYKEQKIRDSIKKS
ncbi:uncharacterized protein LOC125227862 [Leguminivora glycinivorella]|uniref:uncharacterized protein LOC125227862 n=1 Tax=Leguminivora glycinivorella TaxID=1035111 RepID=UPI00200D0011|nr:uncharacterized protein LOC125227862 [Leguminivora glycinivorella]